MIYLDIVERDIKNVIKHVRKSEKLLNECYGLLDTIIGECSEETKKEINKLMGKLEALEEVK